MRRMPLRYVILAHSVNNATHFDLMLEVADQEKLRTFQLAARLEQPGATCGANEISAHRLAYLEYEGDIPGERGFVRRVEAGTWDALGNSLLLSPAGGVCYRLEISAGQACRW